MASIALVTREQFQIRSELEIIHVPTGAVVLTYPYGEPQHMLQSIKVNWGRAGTPFDREFAEQVVRMASQLLLECSRQTEAKRRIDRAA